MYRGSSGRPSVEAALHEIQDLRFDGLVTLERARMFAGPLQAVELPETSHQATKLTVYLGRHDRIGGQPAHRALVELLHQKGIAGSAHTGGTGSWTASETSVA